MTLAPPAPPSAATATHCPYCSLQCGVRVGAAADGVHLEPQQDFPTNRGGLCSKGWNAGSLLGHPERLTTPMVRSVTGDRTSPFRPATWDEALDLVADAIRRSQGLHGADSVGCFGGGGLTNEKAYALGKFARVVLRTSAIDYNGRFCMSSAATAANRAFGIDRGLPFPLADIAKAEAVLLVGSNPAATMPPAMRVFEEGRAAGAVHVVADPRRTATAATASLHLQPRPGTDLALANGLLRLALSEGLIDEDYIERRTMGFGAVRAAVTRYWPDRVERITGVPVADLRRTIRVLGEARSAMILTARGAEQHSNGTDTAQAFVNLALALGLPGRPWSGYGTITGQGNGQGGREHGLKADQLPGYRRLADPADRAHVAAVWGVDPAELPGPGRSAYEMLDRLGTADGVRVLLVLASNIAVSAPDVRRVRDRLARLDLLVVSDLFLGETAELADVVLPTTQFAEEEGTLTNLEGRVIRRRRAIDAPAGVRSDLEILRGLADRLGLGHRIDTDPEVVFDELRRASAGGIADYAGITYRRIEDEQGVFWPCPEPGHPGTPRLFADRFPTPTGRAAFIRVLHRSPAETPDRRYPYVLTTGRITGQYQSGAQTRRHRGDAEAAGEPQAELHRDLAARAGVADGDVVELATRRGTARFRARVSGDIRPDTVFLPFHWGGATSANLLTSTALDPASRMPEFKACAVDVRRIGGPDDGHLLTDAPPAHDPPAAPPPHATDPGTSRRTTRMISENRFLQGIHPFTGTGAPAAIGGGLSRTVPDGVVTQALYFRGGNSTDELITAVLSVDGQPRRYFPIGAKDQVHVPLRVVEDFEGGSVIEVLLHAPDGLTGTVVVDLGMVEH
ncbi:molybdopterin oxidoreductase family protein [Amnibacterium endophyticum]|uniref:Molybdopterin oxidoreductase family protein n=1 Tax=Amnibacterium endophyticum TaxID=2109337 RepID=A0ABW4LGT5_9MICO